MCCLIPNKWEYLTLVSDHGCEHMFHVQTQIIYIVPKLIWKMGANKKPLKGKWHGLCKKCHILSLLFEQEDRF